MKIINKNIIHNKLTKNSFQILKMTDVTTLDIFEHNITEDHFENDSDSDSINSQFDIDFDKIKLDSFQKKIDNNPCYFALEDYMMWYWAKVERITTYRTYEDTTPKGYNGYELKVYPSNGLHVYSLREDDYTIVNKINIKLELRYIIWKKEDIKRMWSVIFAIMSVKNPAKISFCNKLTQIDVNIPIDIAHIIYEFARDKY